MKSVKVEFVEQSKCVTSKVTLEYYGDNTPSNEDILQETQDLYDKAQKYSLLKTMAKNR